MSVETILIDMRPIWSSINFSSLTTKAVNLQYAIPTEETGSESSKCHVTEQNGGPRLHGGPERSSLRLRAGSRSAAPVSSDVVLVSFIYQCFGLKEDVSFPLHTRHSQKLTPNRKSQNEAETKPSTLLINTTFH